MYNLKIGSNNRTANSIIEGINVCDNVNNIINSVIYKHYHYDTHRGNIQ